MVGRDSERAKIGAVRDHEAPSAETIATVRRLVNGYQVTQALHVLVRLGIPDRLANGPRSAADLAVEAGAHERSLYRLLRAVASVGVLDELPDHRFALTELGEVLRTDVPGTVADWAAFVKVRSDPDFTKFLETLRNNPNPPMDVVASAVYEEIVL